MILSLPIKLLLSVLFGGLIGLERESSQNKDNIKHVGSIGGVRTYSLIALLGALSGLMLNQNLPNIFFLIATTMCALVVVYYFLGTSITKRTGMTTEIAAIFTFLIGFFFITGILSPELTVAIFVIILLILSVKIKTQKFVLGVSHKELESFVAYAILALVVLPFLPDKNYLLQDMPVFNNLALGAFKGLEIINPHKLWLIVVLITGIDVLGYTLTKFLNKKGSLFIISLVSGVVSSTLATQNFAQKSKKSKFINQLVGATIIASMASFFEFFVVITPLNFQLMHEIFLTVVLMVATSLIFGLLYFKTKTPKEKGDLKYEERNRDKKMFSLIPAVGFAFLIIAVGIITKTFLILFGNSGFIISSVIASLGGVMAITINLSQMAGKTIPYELAFLVFVLINITNLTAKIVYAFLLGNRSYATKVGVGLILISCAAALGYLMR